MVTLRAFLAFVMLSVLAVPLSAAESPERETLEKAIPYAIKLLEAKDYKAFMENFATPEDLKEITDGEPLEKAAAEWGKETGAHLLAALKKIKDLKPKLADNGNVATYPLPEPIDGETEVVFKKVGKFWFLAE